MNIVAAQKAVVVRNDNEALHIIHSINPIRLAERQPRDALGLLNAFGRSGRDMVHI